MISPETIRRYPFFACLTHDQITTLAMAGEELNVEAGHCFFYEGDKLESLYFVVDGNVDINVGIPDRSAKQDVQAHILGNFINEDIVVSSISAGQLFAWSALIPPYVSTASARASVPSRVIAFDCEELNRAFQEDCQFGFVMLQKVAAVIRQRLRDMRIQSLAWVPA